MYFFHLFHVNRKAKGVGVFLLNGTQYVMLKLKQNAVRKRGWGGHPPTCNYCTQKSPRFHTVFTLSVSRWRRSHIDRVALRRCYLLTVWMKLSQDWDFVLLEVDQGKILRVIFAVSTILFEYNFMYLICSY